MNAALVSRRSKLQATVRRMLVACSWPTHSLWRSAIATRWKAWSPTRTGLSVHEGRLRQTGPAERRPLVDRAQG
jgi:hypothetical protein